MPECPDSIEEFQELEKMLPLCKVTLYEQAKARIETGAAKSVSEAARQLAVEMGRKPGTIRQAIDRADTTSTLSKLTGTAKHAPKPKLPEHKIFDDGGDEWVEPEQVPLVALGEKEIIATANRIKAEKRTEKKEEKKAILESVVVEEPKTEPKRLPQSGEWWELGRHKLYCGDTSSQDFISQLPKCAIAFADPPYNADAANWDNDFNWKHDYLIEHSGIVIVTPGIVSIFDFAKTTSMPYLWSVACVISNGMTRGAIGFGNWIYAAVFSNGSIYRNAQDAMTISIKTSETGETTHKGRKPLEFLALLFDRFTNKGDTILDPFLGSGQSLLACEKIERACIGGEISPEFCAEIINRWESLTGETAHVNSI